MNLYQILSPPPILACHTPVSVLSLFPGAGLLCRGFEELGWSVLRGPDAILHGDIRRFRVGPGCFDGVIGGPPCQDFSRLRRTEPTGYGREMLAEFARCVRDAAPVWWLCENVPGVPDVHVLGYSVQRVNIDASHFGASQRRLRRYQFGRREGLPLIPLPRPVSAGGVTLAPCPVANDSRPVADLAALQGLPADHTFPDFTREGARRIIGNGVPYPVSLGLSEMIEAWLFGRCELARPCRCGCGRSVTGRQATASATCRKQLQRQRDRRDA